MKKNQNVTLTPRITTLLEELTQLILPWLQLEVVSRHEPHHLLEPHRDQDLNLPPDRKIQLVTLTFDTLVDAAQEGDAIAVDIVGRTLCLLAEATDNVWPTAERILTLIDELGDDLTEAVVEQLDFLYRLHRGSAGPCRPPMGDTLYHALRTLAEATPAS